MVTRSDDRDDEDDDYDVEDCSNGNGADDRALSEELVHHANSAGGGETDGISNGMETGAFVAPASMPSPAGDRQTSEIFDHMEERAANFVAPASMPTREQFSIGEEPESQNESCTQGSFGESGSSPVVNGSRLGDRSAAGIEQTFPYFDPDENLQIPGPSESRTDNDDSSVLSMFDDLFGGNSESFLDTDTDQLLAAPQPPTDEAMVATDHATVLETADASMEPNTDAQPSEPPLSTVEDLTNFLRDRFFAFYHSHLFPEEELVQLAQLMLRILPREWVSINDRMSSFLGSLYHALQNLYQGTYPKWMRTLVEWLAERYGPRAASVAGEKSETSVGDVDQKKPSKKRGPYRCSFCGELKVKIINGIKIPHGPCPRHQVTDTGRSQETDPNKNANDIDRVLENPPEGWEVIYARSPNDEDSSGSVSIDGDVDDDDDRKPAAVSRDGDMEDDGDKKPAAVRRDGNVDDDGDKKPAAVDRPRGSRSSARASRAPGVARALELGYCLPVSAPTSKREKPNRAEKSVRGDDSPNVQAPIDREESQEEAQDLSSNYTDNEKGNGDFPKPKDSDESGNE